MVEFNPVVTYTKNIVTYGSFEFLVDVGGSLGLWIGLSVFGLVDFGVDIFNFVGGLKKRFY